MKSDYTEDHIHILLCHLILTPGVIDTALNAGLEGMHLVQKVVGGHVAQAILFDIITYHYKTYATTPDDATLIAETNKFLDRHCSGQRKRVESEQRIKAFLAFKPHVDRKSEGIARKLIQYISEQCIIRPAARELLATPSKSGDISGLSTQLATLESRRNSVGGGLARTGLIDLVSEAGERVATGIPWIDSRTGNGAGLVNGCTLGIIAPQGVGKTTCGIQLGVAQALAGQDVLMALAEEGLTQSVRNKIIGCTLGFDYTLLENRTVDQVIQELNIDPSMARQKLDNINEHFHILDMVASNTVPEGVAPITAEIQQMASAGRTPTYAYVDWAGIIADAVCQTTKRTKESEIQTLVSALSAEAQRQNCIIAISQQMAPAVVARGPFFVPDMYCAADCRQFTATMKYAISINKKDPATGYNLLTWLKSRDDGVAGCTAVMQLRGELATFFDVSAQWELNARRFRKKGAVPSKVPSERR